MISIKHALSGWSHIRTSTIQRNEWVWRVACSQVRFIDLPIGRNYQPSEQQQPFSVSHLSFAITESASDPVLRSLHLLKHAADQLPERSFWFRLSHREFSALIPL